MDLSEMTVYINGKSQLRVYNRYESSLMQGTFSQSQCFGSP